MANKKYEETDIQAIADTIREKTGSEDSFKVSEMASGVDEVYEAGKTKEWNDFWDMLQNYGTKSDYVQAFAFWGAEEIIPKHKVIPTGYANGMFKGLRKLKRINKEYFDLSKANYYPSSSSSVGASFCEYCNNLEVFPDIGLQAGYYSATFADNYKLHTIEILRVAEDSKFSNAVFRSCAALANIVIDGVIGQNLSFSSSPLTVASLKSIITHLKDYSGTTSEYTYTITFKTSAFEALEAEGATAEYNGVACTWEELIDNLKWNLALA